MREIQIISISILLRKYSTQCFFSCVLFFNPIVFYRGMNTDVLHESASFISDANTAIAATGDEG